MVIFGGDRLVSRSLEWSLTNAGCDACFRYEPPGPDGLVGSLAGVRLVLFAPRIGPKRREALLDGLRSVPVTARLPVLELAPLLDENRPVREGVRLVAWPCSTDELLRHIAAALTDTDDHPAQSNAEACA